jgi:hypothetical protein
MLIRNSSKSYLPVYISCYRGSLATDVSPCGAEEDDITGILNVFCKHLAHDKSGKSVLKETVFQPAYVSKEPKCFSFLMHFRVSLCACAHAHKQ